MSESNKILQQELDHYKSLTIQKNSIKIEIANLTVRISEMKKAEEFHVMKLREAEAEQSNYETVLKDKYSMESLDLETGEYQVAKE
jgi:uncharacterized protein involved in exopolysaccharide biosynthesis